MLPNKHLQWQSRLLLLLRKDDCEPLCEAPLRSLLWEKLPQGQSSYLFLFNMWIHSLKTAQFRGASILHRMHYGRFAGVDFRSDLSLLSSLQMVFMTTFCMWQTFISKMAIESCQWPSKITTEIYVKTWQLSYLLILFKYWIKRPATPND